jgi:2-polyprenyl-3-methyl-5-hydroxy-6-metoxy-1,4-benzoquinol methylase/rubredoxin
MVSFDQCPVCGQKDIFKVLTAEDYTVSHELFEIWECRACSLRFTQQAPDEGLIGPYYQSAAYVSHSDTRQGFINKAYHAVRSRTLKSKRTLVRKVTGMDRGSLLDVGSGTGAFLQTMKTAGWEITGLEPDELARKKALELFAIPLEDPKHLFNLAPGTYDAITLWHVLEHVHDLHTYMRRLGELLKSGGFLFIAVPNYTSYDAGVYQQYWAAYDVPRHLYHFSPKAMKTLLGLHSLNLVGQKAMWFDSFYVSMLSEKYRNNRSNLPSALIRGAISNFRSLNHPQNCSSVIYIISR